MTLEERPGSCGPAGALPSSTSSARISTGFATGDVLDAWSGASTAAPIAVRPIAPSRSSRYSRPLFNVSPSSQPALIPTADSLAI